MEDVNKKRAEMGAGWKKFSGKRQERWELEIYTGQTGHEWRECVDWKAKYVV